jgi:hypothetical protein
MRTQVSRLAACQGLALVLAVAISACGPRGWERAAFLAKDEPCELGDIVVGGRVEPGARAVVVPTRKIAWQDTLGGEEAARPHVRARLAAWPARLTPEPRAFPDSDHAFIARLAQDTWRGLEAFTDREHALPVDNVQFGGSGDPAEVRVGDYTNVTSIGLRLIAIVAAHELAFVSTADAVNRINATLRTLARLETHADFFFNYYDTTSLERTSNLVSFVDQSWLTVGLMVARVAFPELASRLTPLIERGNWGLFYDANVRRMRHGYYVHLAAPSQYHYGMLYAESRLGSLIAIGKRDVPETHWFSMLRTLPPSCRWQTQIPANRTRKLVRGHAVAGGWYEWRDIRYVPSWGGSMFEALMPTLVLDERLYAANSLGRNGEAHAEVQRRFALQELGYPVWGMSPSRAPTVAGYGEYGVRPLGALGYGPGAVTPHAGALALAVTPRDAVANLRALALRYDSYGPYGFYDSVDPRTGAVARAYLALDQAMILIAAANYLHDGIIQRHFAADPIVRRVLPMLAAERFFE